jgi:RNA polymerase sigma-70 factor (ECF subfamily)
LAAGGYRNLRPEIEDLTQEILLSLFAREGRKLDQWEPERGSLEGFIGAVARNHVLSVLRSRRANPFTQQSTDPSDLDEKADSSRSDSMARSTEARQSLEILAERLQERLSSLGMQLFQMLFVAEEDVSEVIRKTGLSADAIYQWRARIKKIALEVQGELLGEIPRPPPVGDT